MTTTCPKCGSENIFPVRDGCGGTELVCEKCEQDRLDKQE